MVEKASTQQKGPLGPPIEFGDQLVRRCWDENMSQRGWAPRPPVEQSWRTKTRYGDVRRGWEGQYVAVFVQSPTPSHTHSKFKPVKLRLKIDLGSYPARAEGLGKYDYHTFFFQFILLLSC